MDQFLVTRVRAALDGQQMTELEDSEPARGNGNDSLDRAKLGITNDFEAFAWYRAAAARGDERAQFLIGLAYMAGQGVHRDYDEAADWFRKAAEQGHPKAQQYLDLL